MFTVRHVRQKFDALKEGIVNNDYTLLDLLHHYTSGLKAIYSSDCFDSLLTIRQALGGAGYTAWSGIPYLISDYSPNTTYEGDNTVMAQQSFNYLLKLGI